MSLLVFKVELKGVCRDRDAFELNVSIDSIQRLLYW